MFLEAADAASDATNTAAEAASQSQISWESVLKVVVDWCTTTGIKLIIAIIVMIVSFKLINFITKRIKKRLDKKNADPTIAKVGTNLLRISLKIIIFVCLVGYVGIQTTSISAVILAVSTGISLAVQGTLSNFAGGVIIIIMRPFKLGDFITSNGQSGTVEDIKLFYTQIVTVDNKVVYIPNGTLANGVIVNASVKDTRRCDVVFSVSYDTDIQIAKNAILKVASENNLIFTDPSPFVDVTAYSASSIDITIRAWCNRADYWTVYFYLMNEVKKEFDKENIIVPFTQIDVNINQKNN